MLAVILAALLVAGCLAPSGTGPQGAPATPPTAQVTPSGEPGTTATSQAILPPPSPSPPPPGTLQGSSSPKNAIRAYLDERFPSQQGTDYFISYEVREAQWLDRHSPDAQLIQAFATFRIPPEMVTLVIWNGQVFGMPDDFNRFMRDSGARVTGVEDALDAADLYCKGFEPRGSPSARPAFVLSGADDIPQRWGKVPGDLAGRIQPPSVLPEAGGYSLHLFTWSEVNGIVREWNMTVSDDGNVTAGNRILGEFIGDASTLDE